MSSKRSRAGNRGRGNKPSRPLRKLGKIRTPEIAENNKSQDDEKPPVQKPELAVNVASESGLKQLAQDVGTERKVENSTKEIKSQNVDNVLLRAVNNPVFIPKTSQQTFNPAQTLSSRLASAINAPEFVPGKGFFTHEETAEERLQVIEHFVNNKIKQLTKDPGLLDELSILMENYLSVCIRVENDMIKLSDLLFEKCVSQQNFQYTGSKLANHLDKYLVPKTTEHMEFRVVFLKRCSSEYSRFNDVIHTNPERACNVAIFLGELLMNYKTIAGETITKFLTVVSDTIKQLLLCHDRKLLICAGKLLKLTGSSLNQTDELFDNVTRLASDPRVDRAAQTLFSRVCELRRTSWGQHEIPQTSTYTQPNPYGAQGYSMYIPNIDDMLEEQAPDLPVFVDEQWNEYATDKSSQDDNQLSADFFRRMCMEQYGHYVPFATEDNWSNGHDDDYDAELAAFVKEQRVEAIRAKRARAKSKMKQVSPSAPTDPFDQCNFTTVEGLKVSWKYGNIAQERADILVSSAVSNLNNPTIVGRKLNSVGGPSFMTACSKHTNIGTGDIRTTIGGNLQCNYVIHAVCCRWNSSGVAEQTLRSLFLKILLECARCSARSVAMPLIGTGKHMFPEDVVLRVMREEFEKFSSMNLPGTLKEIKLVRYGQRMKRTTVPAQPVNGSELSLPSNWTLQPENQLVKLVRIATSSQEYLEVFNHFVARGGNASQLRKVERIQNPQLYSRYLAFKKSMRGEVNEMRLFHGTDAANIDSINAHNFSRSFAGVNGVAYGNGVYFARDASYSMGYANRQLSDALPKMYMAKVLVGDYTKGKKGMKAPPLKNDPHNPGLRYDSVVDHRRNPSMYVIFQDNQYYPEYLLTMR